jgi:hypothetical protein
LLDIRGKHYLTPSHSKSGEEMGWWQLPDLVIQPSDGKGKDYFVETRKTGFTFSVKGVLGLIFLGVSLVVFYYSLNTDYWYLGIAFFALVMVFFWWSILTSRAPADLGGRPSK